LKEFYPAISDSARREIFDLPEEAEIILKDLEKAEEVAQRALSP
jgi:hypothetical protein